MLEGFMLMNFRYTNCWISATRISNMPEDVPLQRKVVHTLGMKDWWNTIDDIPGNFVRNTLYNSNIAEIRDKRIASWEPIKNDVNSKAFRDACVWRKMCYSGIIFMKYSKNNESMMPVPNTKEKAVSPGMTCIPPIYERHAGESLKPK